MSATFRVDWPEDEWRALIEAGHRAIERAFQLFTAEFWGNLREDAPVDTGRLAGSFQLVTVSELQHRIVSAVEYAMAVWKGQKAHEIRPRTKKALYWPGAEHPVKRVFHPGTSGNPFVERAYNRAEGRVDDFIARAIAEYAS